MEELRSVLSQAGSQAPAEMLGPIAALNELRAVCDSVAQGREAPYQPNRESLAADVKFALTGLGKGVRDEIGPVFKDFIGTVGKLSTSLGSASETRVVAMETEPFLNRLRSDDVVAAAWRDLQDALQDPSADAEHCELRLMQLAELAEHRGVDYLAWVKAAERAISGNTATVTDLAASLETDAPALDKSGDVPPEQRLRICADALKQLPARQDVAVWCVLLDAQLQRDAIDIGPVKLFRASLSLKDIRDGKAVDDSGETVEGPPELADPQTLVNMGDFLKDSQQEVGCTLARVLVNDTTPTRASDQARSVLRGLIDLTDTDTAWRLLDGEYVHGFRGGGHWSSLRDPEVAERYRRRRPPQFDRTLLGLQQVNREFVASWIAGDPSAARRVDDGLFVAAARQVHSPQQRVILSVRAVEHAFAHVKVGSKGSWVDAALRYLTPMVVNNVLATDIRDAADLAQIVTFHDQHASADLKGRLQHLTHPPQGAKPYTWQEFVEALAELLPEANKLLTEPSRRKRILSEAERLLTDPVFTLGRLADLKERADTMIKRTSRQRNSLTHGTGTDERVLRNVDPFALLIAQFSAGPDLLHDPPGIDPLAEMEKDRLHALEREARLKARHDPWKVMWR